jgi:hypothetical protein
MPSYTEAERVALAVVFMVHMFTSLSWPAAFEAVRNNKEITATLPDGAWNKTKQQEARRAGKKFMEAGTITNLPRAKKLNTNLIINAITPEEARMASLILKTGYVDTKCDRQGRITENHHYYESLTQAMGKVPYLKTLYDKYDAECVNVCPATFMEALYTYDPFLRERRLHMKYALGEELKDQRQKRAHSLFERAKKNPNFLKCVFFVDECTLNFDHVIRKGVHVYCDAHDKGYRFVIPITKLHANRSIKVKVMGAVNGLTGAVFLEFTTGTTDIERQHNTPGGDTRHKYQVGVLHSYSLLNKDNNAPWCHQHLGTRQPADKCLYIRLHAPRLIDKHTCVTHTQQNTQGVGSIEASM